MLLSTVVFRWSDTIFDLIILSAQLLMGRSAHGIAMVCVLAVAQLAKPLLEPNEGSHQDSLEGRIRDLAETREHSRVDPG